LLFNQADLFARLCAVAVVFAARGGRMRTDRWRWGGWSTFCNLASVVPHDSLFGLVPPSSPHPHNTSRQTLDHAVARWAEEGEEKKGSNHRARESATERDSHIAGVCGQLTANAICVALLSLPLPSRRRCFWGMGRGEKREGCVVLFAESVRLCNCDTNRQQREQNTHKRGARALCCAVLCCAAHKRWHSPQYGWCARRRMAPLSSKKCPSLRQSSTVCETWQP